MPQRAGAFVQIPGLWTKLHNITHLYHKQQICTESCFPAGNQFPEMFDATLCRRIRKGDNAVLFQCDALHFQKGLHFAVCDSEVEPGIPIGDFSLNYGIFGEKRTLAQPFLRSIVWNLGVQIDEQGSLSGVPCAR